MPVEFPPGYLAKEKRSHEQGVGIQRKTNVTENSDENDQRYRQMDIQKPFEG